jgi:hypothetical protein
MVKYKRKRPDGITRPTADQKYAKEHTGYTAQQLIEIGLDEFVEQPTTSDGYMSVSYGNIQFMFNAGVQELIKRDKEKEIKIDDLTNRLAILESKDSIKYSTELEARVSKLEQLIQENIMNRFFAK